MSSSSSELLLPLELIFEILLLLPVVTLVRLRVVSKQWRALIDSSTFQKSHLNHHQYSSKKAASDDSLLMISFTKRGAVYIDMYSLLWDAGSAIPEKLSNPRRACITDFSSALTPINGVLCVITVRHGALLWNPFIRKHLKVPQPPQQQPYHDRYGPDYYCLWSFGYDSHLDDYKLVFVSQLEVKKNGGLGRFPVWVYSVKLGFWKSIGDMPYSLSLSTKPGAFVSGALHWRARREIGGPEFILALHLRNLEYHLVPLPKCLDDAQTTDDETGFNLGVLDGRLYVHYFSYTSSDFESWVMKEYGVKESWTRLITSTYSRRILTPITYVENGNKLLFFNASNSLVGYDSETRSCKSVSPGVLPESSYPFAYTPSLIFPARNGVGVCAKKF